MPKQPGDISKAGRMLLVWEAVQALGRATPDGVFRAVAKKMNISPDDKNLRRNIYRDLKSFSNSGKLYVEYFTPDGVLIPPDEESDHGSVRLEFFIPDAQGDIPGHQLLMDRGGLFTPSKQRKIKWSIQFLEQAKLEKHITIIFETPDHHFLTLQFPRDELPVKLLIARNPGSTAKHPPPQVLDEILGLRYGVLFLKNRTLSRPETGSKVGHALIEISDDGKYLRITDLGSKSGTQWSPTTLEFLEELNTMHRIDATLQPDAGLAGQKITWNDLDHEEEYSLPVMVRMGGFPIIVA